MACPDCGSPAGEFRFSTTIETHGLDCGPFERFEQEYIVCLECGGRFDVADWDDVNAPSISVTDEDCLIRPEGNGAPSEPPVANTTTASDLEHVRFKLE
jgi:hypothetical protein